MTFQRYPMWIDVDGPGHPENGGKVLVNNEDEERVAKRKGKGPAGSNPPPDPGAKALKDMERDDLIVTLTREGFPKSFSDTKIRHLIEEVREEKAKETAKSAREHAKDDGGDHGDGLQTDKAPPADPKPVEDARGDKVSEDPAKPTTKPKSSPATDTRPLAEQAKKPADKPAGNVTDVMAKPADKDDL